MARHGRKPKGRILLRNKAIPAALASLATSVLMYLLYYANFDLSYGSGASAIIFASFGSSAFLMFLMPELKSARIPTFVKSYVMAAILGEAGFYMSMAIPLYAVVGIIVFAMSLLMYVVGGLHPPAIAIALAFVLFHIGIYGVLIVLFGIVILVALKFLLERFVYIVEGNAAKGRRLIPEK